MIFNKLCPAILALAFSSCGDNWEVVQGPVRKFGDPIEEAEESDDEMAEEATPQVRRSRPAASPRPLKDNPFAVPDVITNLPEEKDLKSGTAAPSSVPVDPQDPEAPKATVTTRPSAEEE